MIELVDRLEAEDERRIAVLFEHDRREQRGFETMRAAAAERRREAAQRRAAVRLLVVGKRVEIPLNRSRRSEARDQPSLARREAMRADGCDRLTSQAP